MNQTLNYPHVQPSHCWSVFLGKRQTEGGDVAALKYVRSSKEVPYTQLPHEVQRPVLREALRVLLHVAKSTSANFLNVFLGKRKIEGWPDACRLCRARYRILCFRVSGRVAWQSRAANNALEYSSRNKVSELKRAAPVPRAKGWWWTVHVVRWYFPRWRANQQIHPSTDPSDSEGTS
jgi:hypothetical protein